MKMKKCLLFVLISVSLFSCDGFNKLLKSNDNEKKYTKMKEYYEGKEYIKAMTLIEDLIPIYRGTNKSEDLYYYYAWSHYYEADYFSAAFYFNSFVETFPISKRAEECAFYAALCNFYESPRYSLDQSQTYSAIESFQLYLERYPETTKRDSCNLIITELREKLEVKDYNNAELYYKTQWYKSAVISLNNTVKDYPSSEYEEDMRFKILKASYELAINSVIEKKQERLEATIKAYQNYIDKFADAKRAGQAETLYKKTLDLMDNK